MRGTAGAKPIPMIRDGFRYPNLISASVGAHRYHIGGLTPLRTIVMFGAAITTCVRRGALWLLSAAIAGTFHKSMCLRSSSASGRRPSWFTYDGELGVGYAGRGASDPLCASKSAGKT
jgi:hypothetical protein